MRAAGARIRRALSARNGKDRLVSGSQSHLRFDPMGESP
jgi:hypothetical protein